ncbi:MAG TPA: cyclic beta 1-2 glucan synthetase, partial [Pirellulales bacterium]
MHVTAMKDRIRRMVPWRESTGKDALPQKPPEEPPLRAELYSVDQLERHARIIAAAHRLAPGRTPDKLLPRLAENERVLVDTYDLITAATERNRRIAPAAEWLLDNFYLIEEQIRSTRRLLPRSYSGELPRLANRFTGNYPRAYGIALELIAHTDGRVDAAGLDGFIAAYQAVVPLTLGELWALPLMLRLALIENLRRVAARISAARCDRDLAADWAERMIHTVEQSPTDLILVLADMARANPPLTGAFLAELTRHLHGQNPNFAFANGWLEHRLSDQGLTTEQLVLAEGQAQAADQVSVGNSITSLRFLSVNDWRQFVAEHSLVEQTLRGDPAGVYESMDFATRDRYRHAVEAIAKRSHCSEYDVAHRAVQLSQSEAADRAMHRTTHVGYFLVDRGRPVLERLVEMRLTPGVVLDKLRRYYPLFVYLFLVFLVTGASAALPLEWGGWQMQPVSVLVLLAIPLLMCAGQLGVAVVNWLATVVMNPQPLPRMDFSTGIPAEHRTLVVVPTMLSSAG